MKRPQLVSQGSLSRMLSGAQEAWNRRDFQQCFDLLERAGRMDPGNWRIQLHLGQSYGLRYDYAAAERCLEKAMKLAPNKTEALASVARVTADFVGDQIAERYYKRALEQKDVGAETIAGLAELYERLRRLEEAGQLVERALAIDRSCAAAALVRARIERQAGRLEDAERTVRGILGTAGREPKIRAYYELGAILDRQGRYDEAMSAWLEAKALLKPDAPPLIAQIRETRAMLDEMLAGISVATLQRWRECAASLQPERRLALLCGHPRSGTTLLEQVLDAHPEMASAEETEVFNDDVYSPLARSQPNGTKMLSILDGASIELLNQCRENYFRVMDLRLGHPLGSRLLIDKNPSFNALIPAYVRVFPETKFLIALRDPRDVCLSGFMQAFVPLSKGAALGLSLEGMVEGYTKLMGPWLTLKPMLTSPWLEVRYEDMVENLESVSRKVLEFLEVPWDDRVLRFNEHTREQRIRTPTYADVTKPVFKTAMGRWRRYQKYFEPHLAKLEPYLKAFGYES
jgi:tetratricopeptide (TPR) repeat protein